MVDFMVWQCLVIFKGHCDQGRFLRTGRKQISLLSWRIARGRIWRNMEWSTLSQSLARRWSKTCWKPFPRIWKGRRWLGV